MDNETLSVRIDGINILEKMLYTTFFSEEVVEYNFQLKSQCVIGNRPNIIATLVSVKINKLKDEKIVARFLAEFGYEVSDLDKILIKHEGGKITIPVELENYLKSISISSMRGIVYSELRGTAAHGAVLPIILIDSMKPDPSNILDESKAEKNDTD